MFPKFWEKIAKNAVKYLKIRIIGEGSTLKFQLMYKNTIISEDFVVLSMINFENKQKKQRNIH